MTVEDADAIAARTEELGGTVFAGPFDVLEAGRMTAITDPTGGVHRGLATSRHFGATLVNEPGAMTWNDLQTIDVAAAREFYSGLVGWTVEEVPESGGRYWTIQGPEGSNGGMMPLPMEGIPPRWEPYFAVESLDDAEARVRERGGTPLTEPIPVPGGSLVAVRDPQSAVFSLFAGRLDP